MILTIDIGNTTITFGVFEKERLVHKFKLLTHKTLNTDNYMYLLETNLAGFKDKIEVMVFCSVVPSLDDIFKAIAIKMNVECIEITVQDKGDLKIMLEDETELGSDILVGVLAAIKKYKEPLIVIDLGTAISMAAVNEKKEMLGGIIMPGMATSYKALFNKAAKLNDVEIAVPKNVIGKNTKESLQSGMTYGFASLLDGMIRKVKKQMGEAKVIITGGNALDIMHLFEEKIIYDENLLLEGLLMLAKK